MLPLLDRNLNDVLKERPPGFYYPASMVMMVRNFQSLIDLGEVKDIERTSIFLHEYAHHLQFAATSAGLAYHQAQMGLGLAFINFVKGFKLTFPDKRVPRSLIKLKLRSRNEPLKSAVDHLSFELLYRNNFLGWPLNASVKACPQIAVFDDNRFALIPVGAMVLSENYARLQQTRYLMANITDDSGNIDREIWERYRIKVTDVETQIRYLSVLYGFIDTLKEGEIIGENLFLCACNKAFMPAVLPYFSSEQESFDFMQKIESSKSYYNIWPGSRYSSIIKLFFRSDLKKKFVNLCNNGNFEEIDYLVSSILGWPTQAEIIRQLEEQIERVGSPLIRKIIKGAVLCYKKLGYYFLMDPLPMNLDIKINEIPPIGIYQLDGWVGISGWCDLAERFEVADWHLLSCLFSAICYGQKLNCTYRDCSNCPKDLTDILEISHKPEDCPFESRLNDRFGISLNDFESKVT